jgi:hypothetical protein
VTKPALIPIEGPEKATRGGVNGSQSKLLTVTWPISQTPKSDTPSAQFLALVKSDEFSALVKSDKPDKQNGQVFSPGKIRLVKSDKTDKISALVKSDW